MGIQYPSNFGSHRDCCSGDMVVYLVVEGEDSSYPCLNPPLSFISKAHIAYQTHTHKI